MLYLLGLVGNKGMYYIGLYRDYMGSPGVSRE